MPLNSSFRHIKKKKGSRRAERCSITPPALLFSACLCLPHFFFPLSLSRRALEVVLLRSRSKVYQGKREEEGKKKYAQLNWTLSRCLHLILGVSSAHSHQAGLSFPLTDRDNPLSSTTSEVFFFFSFGVLGWLSRKHLSIKYHLSLHSLYFPMHRKMMMLLPMPPPPPSVPPRRRH